MTDLSPWIRVIAVINQRNLDHPVGHASIDAVTSNPNVANRRVRNLTDLATRTGHALPSLAATQTAAIIPIPADLIDLIRRLTDPDPCHHDHHGECQAHGQGSDAVCADHQAQRLLAAWDAIDPTERSIL